MSETVQIVKWQSKGINPGSPVHRPELFTALCHSPNSLNISFYIESRPLIKLLDGRGTTEFLKIPDSARAANLVQRRRAWHIPKDLVSRTRNSGSKYHFKLFIIGTD